MTFPDYYMITGKFSDLGEFAGKLEQALREGNKIVQLRCKQISDSDEYLALAETAQGICDRYDTTLLLATDAETFIRSNAGGLHLTSHALAGCEERPVEEGKLLSVSCHTAEDLAQASRLGADILLLSPVKATSSHPGVPGIGWQAFREMTAGIDHPVYALGGMAASDLQDAKAAGAAGVAAISSFWK
ncbi:MAG: thiamine phosphate synthase [Candidatus Sedimenticola sp. 20ELBAFRAG]